MTERSQLHLESVIAALRPVFCMVLSSRAEPRRSATMRSTSLEAGLLFISFDDLLTRINDVVCTVVDNTHEAWLQDPQDEPVV